MIIGAESTLISLGEAKSLLNVYSVLVIDFPLCNAVKSSKNYSTQSSLSH